MNVERSALSVERSGPAGRGVFLSYAREDTAAVKRIAEALRGAGVEVWFDQSELVGGDAWDQKIRKQIKECALFVPIISAQTQARAEGYFRLEWLLAAERTRLIGRTKAFLLPVCLDGTKEAEADVPESFVAVQWTRLPAGATPAAFGERVNRLLGPAAGSTFSEVARPVSAGTPAPALASSPAAQPPKDFATAKSPAKSVAVLPFANLSADAENEYFSDGMTEEIINALVQVPGMQVAARTSVFAFKGKADDLRTIARKLDVRTVLEGSVRKAGNRIRITAQLIDAANGYHLWSERFDRALDDIFAVQDEIARTIVEKLKVKLVGDGQPLLVTPPTDDLEAYQLYLQGRFFWNQRGAGLAKGLKCFEAALARDPHYALAHTGVADAFALLAFYGYARPNDVMPKARAAAERALAIDPELAEAHCALGWVQLSYDWNPPAALREFQRAIALKPTYVPARNWCGACLVAMRRFREGVASDEEGVRLEPFSPLAYVQSGWRLLYVDRTHDAARRLEHALALEPRFMMAHWLLGQAYLALGRNDEGLAELRTAGDLSANLVSIGATIGCALAHIGRTAEARAVLADLTRRAEHEYVRAILFAMLHAYLGEEDRAFLWLERARDERDPWLPYFEILVPFTGIGIPPRYLTPARRAAFVESLGIIRE